MNDMDSINAHPMGGQEYDSFARQGSVVNHLFEQRKKQFQLAGWFRELGEPRFAERVSACGSLVKLMHIPQKGYGFHSISHCGVRGCSACHARQVYKTANRIRPLVERQLSQGCEVRSLSLTAPSIPRLSRSHTQWLFEQWSMLRDLPLCSDVKGSLVTWETTFREAGAHPQLYAVLVSGYIPKASIREAWYDLTGGTQIKIRLGNEDSLFRMLTYCAKPFPVTSATKLSELLDAINGVTIIRTKGVLRKKSGEEVVADPVPEGAQDFGVFNLDKSEDKKLMVDFMREASQWVN
jgi:hypothetical protein